MRIDYDAETKRVAAMSDISRSAFVLFILALLIVTAAAFVYAGCIYG